jgi:serine/threonine protein kinase
MSAEDLATGAVLQDTYRIVRQIGRGGMGAVYEAIHLRLAGRYAVKVLLSQTAADPQAFARFRREAEVTSGLRHPNIVQVIDFNQTPQGNPYLVMEFLEGCDLAGELARLAGPMPLARVAAVLRQTVSGLGAAHSRGVIHRDLKPDNLFLARIDGEEGEVLKILDFGISKVKEATTKLTRESAVFGTAHYMSPEQAAGQIDRIDIRSDQFSLAAIVYQMLAGQEPFNGDSVAAIVYQVVHAEPRPLPLLNPTITPDLATVIAKAMSKDRDQRFSNVREFFNAFARTSGIGLPASLLLSGPSLERGPAEPAAVAPTDPLPPKLTSDAMSGEIRPDLAARPGRRRRIWALGMAGAVALVAGTIVLSPAARRVPAPGPVAGSRTITAPARPPARVAPLPPAAVAPANEPAPPPTAAVDPEPPAAPDGQAQPLAAPRKKPPRARAGKASERPRAPEAATPARGDDLLLGL